MRAGAARVAGGQRDGARAAGVGVAGAAARLRIGYRPDRDDALAVECTSLDLPRPPVDLRTVTLPGGIGAHKWIDRRLLDALTAHVAPAQPLLCDLDGRVLEAARANVFVLAADGTLCTPPLDGRILPGVTRARVLEVAGELGIAARETVLTPGMLLGAREVFVTGALGGAEFVHSLDGRPLPAAGLAERIADRLAGAARRGLRARRATGSPSGRGTSRRRREVPGRRVRELVAPRGMAVRSALEVMCARSSLTQQRRSSRHRSVTRRGGRCVAWIAGRGGGRAGAAWAGSSWPGDGVRSGLVVMFGAPG